MRQKTSAWKRLAAAATASAFLYVNAFHGALLFAGDFWQGRKAAADKFKQENGAGRPVQAESPLQESSTLLAQLPDLNLQPISSEAEQLGLQPQIPAGENPPSAAISGLPLPGWFKKLPLRYATLRDLYLPEGWKENDLLVIHVQDAHENFEAQRNIAGIIEYLADSQSLKQKQTAPENSPLLVGIEGARGAFNFSEDRAFPDTQISREISDYFLKESMITGPEYAGMTYALETGEEPSLQPPMLYWGIEDEKLYLAHVDALKGSIIHEKEAKETLENLRGRIDALKEKIYSPSLKELDRHITAYHSGKEKLGDYIAHLAGDGRAIAQLPTVKQFLSALKIERSLDFKAVEAQRKELMEALLKNLPQAELKRLAGATLAFRMGQSAHGAFYRYLNDLCAKYGVSFARHPQMEKYLRYVLASEKIKPDSLFGEMEKLEKDRTAALARSGPEKELARCNEDVLLTGKLFSFGLSPAEWERYLARKGEIEKLESRIALLAGEKGNPSPSGKYEEFLQKFGEFNKCAIARNHSLVNNLLAKNAANGAEGRIALLVAGGFHTEGVSRILKEKKIAYAVLTPRLDKVGGDGTKYLEIFTRDKTPLEKLFTGERITLAPQCAHPVQAMGTEPTIARVLKNFGRSLRIARLFGSKMEKTGLKAEDVTDDVRATVSRWQKRVGLPFGVEFEVQKGIAGNEGLQLSLRFSDGTTLSIAVKSKSTQDVPASDDVLKIIVFGKSQIEFGSSQPSGMKWRVRDQLRGAFRGFLSGPLSRALSPRVIVSRTLYASTLLLPLLALTFRHALAAPNQATNPTPALGAAVSGEVWLGIVLTVLLSLSLGIITQKLANVKMDESSGANPDIMRSAIFSLVVLGGAMFLVSADIGGIGSFIFQFLDRSFHAGSTFSVFSLGAMIVAVSRLTYFLLSIGSSHTYFKAFLNNGLTYLGFSLMFLNPGIVGGIALPILVLLTYAHRLLSIFVHEAGHIVAALITGTHKGRHGIDITVDFFGDASSASFGTTGKYSTSSDGTIAFHDIGDPSTRSYWLKTFIINAAGFLAQLALAAIELQLVAGNDLLTYIIAATQGAILTSTFVFNAIPRPYIFYHEGEMYSDWNDGTYLYYSLFRMLFPLRGKASIFDDWAKRKWGKSSWKYILYTVFGVNWEAIIHFPVIQYFHKAIVKLVAPSVADEIGEATASKPVMIAGNIALALGGIGAILTGNVFALVAGAVLWALSSGYVFSGAHKGKTLKERIVLGAVGSVLAGVVVTPAIFVASGNLNISYPLAVVLGLTANFVLHSLYNLGALASGITPASIKKAPNTLLFTGRSDEAAQVGKSLVGPQLLAAIRQFTPWQVQLQIVGSKEEVHSLIPAANSISVEEIDPDERERLLEFLTGDSAQRQYIRFNLSGITNAQKRDAIARQIQIILAGEFNVHRDNLKSSPNATQLLAKAFNIFLDRQRECHYTDEEAAVLAIRKGRIYDANDIRDLFGLDRVTRKFVLLATESEQTVEGRKAHAYTLSVGRPSDLLRSGIESNPYHFFSAQISVFEPTDEEVEKGKGGPVVVRLFNLPRNEEPRIDSLYDPALHDELLAQVVAFAETNFPGRELIFNTQDAARGTAERMTLNLRIMGWTVDPRLSKAGSFLMNGLALICRVPQRPLDIAVPSKPAAMKAADSFPGSILRETPETEAPPSSEEIAAAHASILHLVSDKSIWERLDLMLKRFYSMFEPSHWISPEQLDPAAPKNNSPLRERLAGIVALFIREDFNADALRSWMAETDEQGIVHLLLKATGKPAEQIGQLTEADLLQALNNLLRNPSLATSLFTRDISLDPGSAELFKLSKSGATLTEIDTLVLNRALLRALIPSRVWKTQYIPGTGMDSWILGIFSRHPEILEEMLVMPQFSNLSAIFKPGQSATEKLLSMEKDALHYALSRTFDIILGNPDFYETFRRCGFEDSRAFKESSQDILALYRRAPLRSTEPESLEPDEILRLNRALLEIIYNEHILARSGEWMQHVPLIKEQIANVREAAAQLEYLNMHRRAPNPISLDRVIRSYEDFLRQFGDNAQEILRILQGVKPNTIPNAAMAGLAACRNVLQKQLEVPVPWADEGMKVLMANPEYYRYLAVGDLINEVEAELANLKRVRALLAGGLQAYTQTEGTREWIDGRTILDFALNRLTHVAPHLHEKAYAALRQLLLYRTDSHSPGTLFFDSNRDTLKGQTGFVSFFFRSERPRPLYVEPDIFVRMVIDLFDGIAVQNITLAGTKANSLTSTGKGELDIKVTLAESKKKGFVDLVIESNSKNPAAEENVAEVTTWVRAAGGSVRTEQTTAQMWGEKSPKIGVQRIVVTLPSTREAALQGAQAHDTAYAKKKAEQAPAPGALGFWPKSWSLGRIGAVEALLTGFVAAIPLILRALLHVIVPNAPPESMQMIETALSLLQTAFPVLLVFILEPLNFQLHYRFGVRDAAGRTYISERFRSRYQNKPGFVFWRDKDARALARNAAFTAYKSSFILVPAFLLGAVLMLFSFPILAAGAVLGGTSLAVYMHATANNTEAWVDARNELAGLAGDIDKRTADPAAVAGYRQIGSGIRGDLRTLEAKMEESRWYERLQIADRLHRMNKAVQLLRLAHLFGTGAKNHRTEEHPSILPEDLYRVAGYLSQDELSFVMDEMAALQKKDPARASELLGAFAENVFIAAGQAEAAGIDGRASFAETFDGLAGLLAQIAPGHRISRNNARKAWNYGLQTARSVLTSRPEKFDGDLPSPLPASDAALKPGVVLEMFNLSHIDSADSLKMLADRVARALAQRQDGQRIILPILSDRYFGDPGSFIQEVKAKLKDSLGAEERQTLDAVEFLSITASDFDPERKGGLVIEGIDLERLREIFLAKLKNDFHLILPENFEFTLLTDNWSRFRGSLAGIHLLLILSATEVAAFASKQIESSLRETLVYAVQQ